MTTSHHQIIKLTVGPIAISEIWVSEAEQNKFNISGYDVYVNFYLVSHWL